jgi:hypothetical protein
MGKCDCKAWDEHDDWCSAHPMNQLQEEVEQLKEEVEKPIRIKLEFSTLVFLMKKRNMFVMAREEGRPSIEIVLEKDDHPYDLQEALNRLEEEWDQQ